MFHWFHDRRRREILAEQFPAAWLEVLSANVGYYALLSRSEQAKLRDDLHLMIAEKNWEGCGGLEMTDEVRVTVAGQAALLLLGWGQAKFINVESILVYPAGYVAREQDRLWGSWNSVVTESPSPRLGQATDSGTVVLSWDAVLEAGRDPASANNVVLHEFAHVLDARDGSFDGAPILAADLPAAEWERVMAEEYDSLARATEQGHRTLFDPYGATNAAEFFAVVTEYFFGMPRKMRETKPILYDLLRHYYRQDPASRFEQSP